MKLEPGDRFFIKKKITDSVIRTFAELSGDNNPIHLDDDAAALTPFGRRVAHGMISGALISAVLGIKIDPGKIVYLSQTMKFTAPVFVDDVITAEAEVVNVREDKPIVTLSTVCRNEDGATVVEGEATVLVLS